MSVGCIFCSGNGRLSKEHIYPDWLKEHLIRSDAGLSRHKVTQNSQEPKTGKLQRPIDFHKQKLRVVCESCNNGWMSRLQSLSKPHLIPLLNGDWSNLTEESYNVISAWSAMFTIVNELAHPETATVPKAERYFLKENNLPSPTWNIWLGKHNPQLDHPALVNHFGFKTSQQSFQTTGFTVGKLFIQTFMASPTCDLSATKIKEFDSGFDTVKIFPKNSIGYGAIPVKNYTKSELLLVSNSIAKSFKLRVMDDFNILWN